MWISRLDYIEWGAPWGDREYGGLPRRTDNFRGNRAKYPSVLGNDRVKKPR